MNEQSFGEIRIPEIGGDLNGRNRVNTKWIVKGHVKGRNASAFEVERSLSADGKTESVTITAATCAGCEKVFRSADDVGGTCCQCKEVMCQECCEEKIDVISERPACPQCAYDSSIGWRCW